MPQTHSPPWLPRYPVPCPAKRDMQSAGACLVLGVQKPRNPQKSVGDESQWPPETCPWGLESSNCSPVVQLARQPQGLLCTPAFPHQLPQAGCLCWTERYQGNLPPRHQGKAALGKGVWAVGAHVALGGRGSYWGLEELGQGTELWTQVVMCPCLCAALEVGCREEGREGGMKEKPPPYLPSAQAGSSQARGVSSGMLSGGSGGRASTPKIPGSMCSPQDNTGLAQATCWRPSGKLEETGSLHHCQSQSWYPPCTYGCVRGSNRTHSTMQPCRGEEHLKVLLLCRAQTCCCPPCQRW